eukprot:70563-Amphidinium_carterae.1
MAQWENGAKMDKRGNRENPRAEEAIGTTTNSAGLMGIESVKRLAGDLMERRRWRVMGGNHPNHINIDLF